MNGKLCAVGIGLTTVVASGACAGDVVFQLDGEFSGATAPSGEGPWLTATFSQTAQQFLDGCVILTMDAGLLLPENSTAKVLGWMFNYDPQYDQDTDIHVTDLTFTKQSGIDTKDGTVSTGVDHKKADGDGFYDIWFNFGADEDESLFSAGLTSVWKIMTPNGFGSSITPESFNFLSTLGQGNNSGPYLTAAHVGGLGDNGNDSGWLTVIPLPGVAAMATVGLGLMVVRPRRLD